MVAKWDNTASRTTQGEGKKIGLKIIMGQLGGRIQKTGGSQRSLGKNKALQG